MSFQPVTTYQQGSHFEELGADFFNDFVSFSPTDYTSSIDQRLSEPSSTDYTLNGTSNFNQFQEWSNESWAFNQFSSTFDNGHNLYSELSGRAAISDSELLSLEGIDLESTQFQAATHHSLPSSPSQSQALPSRKQRLVDSLTKKIKSSTSSLEKKFRSPIRKSGLSPRTTTRNASKSEIWEHNLEEFDFSIGQSSPIVEVERQNEDFAAELDVLNYAYTTPHKNSVLTYDTPLFTPALDGGHSRKTSSQMHSDQAGPPSTPQYDQQTSEWSNLALSATDLNTFGNPTYGVDGDAPIWWSDASAAPMAQPSPIALHFNTQCATKTLAYQLTSELTHNTNKRMYMPRQTQPGHSIHMASGSPPEKFMVASPGQQQHGYIAPPQPYHHGRSRKNAQYPHPYAQHSSPPRRQLPVSSTHDLKSFQVRKRRSAKREKSTSQTPTLGSAFNFVNFTPDDSKKILTGVAPSGTSGSSKARAKREREALEKRRKSKEAALRAAGGDVDTLADQRLLS